MSELTASFDSRRTVQLLGFSGRAATTTIHDATETGFQISDIFQAAEDFANVQLFSAYDYFNHHRDGRIPRPGPIEAQLPFPGQDASGSSARGG